MRISDWSSDGVSADLNLCNRAVGIIMLMYARTVMVIALLVEDTIPIAIDNEHAVARRNPYVAWHAYIFQRLFQHDLGAPGASHIAKLRSNCPGKRYKEIGRESCRERVGQYV